MKQQPKRPQTLWWARASKPRARLALPSSRLGTERAHLASSVDGMCVGRYAARFHLAASAAPLLGAPRATVPRVVGMAVIVLVYPVEMVGIPLPLAQGALVSEKHADFGQEV